MFMEILKKIYTVVFDTLQSILVFGSIMIVIYVFVMRPFEVSGQSMFPTFKNGEFILTDLITPKYRELHRGDVIVFRSPVEENKDYIKRIIALEGDTVELREGIVYVNGEKSDESVYLDNSIRTPDGNFLRQDEPFVVPDGKVIAMGDNRLNSSDSREWGTLDVNEIIGKSFFVYWPPNHMRIITNPHN